MSQWVTQATKPFDYSASVLENLSCITTVQSLEKWAYEDKVEGLTVWKNHWTHSLLPQQIPLNKASVLGAAPVELLNVHGSCSSSQVCSVLLLNENMQDNAEKEQVCFHKPLLVNKGFKMCMFWHVEHSPQKKKKKKKKKQGHPLCAWSKTKLCHICKKKKKRKRREEKINVACFNLVQVDCSAFRNSLHSRLLPAIRQSGTKTHVTAMQTGFLHSQTKWDYFLLLRLFRASVHVVSQPLLEHILCICTSKKKKKKYNKKRSQLLGFTYWAEWTQPELALYSHHSFSL